jgi:Immunoglobulin I-set domain/Immunoglobulin domain
MRKIATSILTACLFLLPLNLSAQIRMSGIFAFNRVGPQVTYGIERIDNYRPLFSVSGTLAIQLWATALPYTGSGSLFGYKLTETSIGRLNGGFFLSNIVRTQTFFEPPPGNYNIVFVLAEWDGFSYVTVDWSNFSTRQTFGPVALPPSIVAQPQSFSLNVGQSGSFAVAASGTQPLYYQWYRNGEIISGATQATLSVFEALTSDAGRYTVIVGNAAGTVLSSEAILRVNVVAPSIITHPVSQSATAGASVGFSVSVSGSAPLNYQWKRGPTVLTDGGNVIGASTANLSLANIQSSDAGNYICVVANSAGSATSGPATLTVNNPPIITSQPTNRTIAVGGSASFTVVATGTGPLAYQWKKGTANVVNGAGISGATTATLTVTSAQLIHAGDYTVVVTNSVGSATSERAVLAVLSLPTIAAQPTNRTVAAGSCVVFAVQAGGSPPYGYRWKKGTVALGDGPNVTGAASASLSLCNVQTGDAGTYSCVVTNGVGSVTSTAATLTVNNPPLITSQPTNRTIAVGGSASFTVVATGTGPLAYQWKKGTATVANGAGISGASTPTLTITGAQLAQAGDYTVIITNSVGSATSSPAVLVVQPLQPVIVNQPVALVVARTHGQAATATFGVTANGAGTLSYQWRYNGTNMPGRTASTLTLTNVHRSDSGLYSVRVSNAAGSTNSANAELRVIAAAFIRGVNQRPDGQWRLTVADAEGLPYLVGNIPILEIRGSADLTLPVSQWPLLGNASNSVLSGGALLIDIPGTTEARRYFRTVER